MTSIGAAGSGNGYSYGIHSPTTDRIYQALEDLEKQEKAAADELENLPAKARQSRTALPGLGKQVGRFKKKEMQPEVLRVYEKQFRGSQLENYGMIKEAARKELENEGLTPENRRQLIKAIDEADKRILDISAKFYETHPKGDEFRLAPGEEVSKILIEEKFLIESRIKIISREIKKNEGQQKQVREALSPVQHQIEHAEAELKRIPTGDPNGQAAALNEKLDRLRSQAKELKGKLNTLKLANEILQGNGEACIERLDKVLQDIADIKGEKQARLEPNKILKFLAGQVPDEVLADPAKELLSLIEVDKLGPKEAEGVLKNIGIKILALGRDLIVAKGAKNKLKVLKERIIYILPDVALYSTIYLISVHGSSILAGLGTAFAATKAFFLAAGAAIGIANPVGAIILGIAVSGVMIYGLGLLISKNKAYIVKAFTPLTSTVLFLAKGLNQLYLMIKNKVSPNLHVSLKLKPLPEGTERIKDQLGDIADQARLSAEKAKLNSQMQGLVQQLGPARKKIEDLSEQMRAKGIELLAVIHSDKTDKQAEKARLNTEIERLKGEVAKAKEAVKDLQKQIQTKEIELTLKDKIMANHQLAKVKVYQLKKLVLEFPEILKKLENPSIPETERLEILPRLNKVTPDIAKDFNQLKDLVGLEYAQEMIKKAEIPKSDWLLDLLPDLNRAT